MSNTSVNGRSIVHQGDGQTEVSATPDVCKTPSPSGPIPVPYVNVAQDSDLSEGSTSVFIEGNAIALKSSSLSTSTGDEPGTAGGGLISAKTKGKVTWSNYSIDVKIEGKGVVRFMDATQHNANTGNCIGIQMGKPDIVWAYGDDPLGSDKCPASNCGKDKATHRVPESPDSQAMARALIGMLEISRIKHSNAPTLKKGKGFMVGVLLCKGYEPTKGGLIYAAMSGEKNTPGFEKAVAALKDGEPRWTPCAGERVDLNQALCAPDMKPDAKFFENLVAGIPEILVDDGSGGRKPLNRPTPGNCAAPKLIQTARQAGHHPLSMTEVFYSPTKPESVTTLVTYTSQEDAEKKIIKELMSFGHNESVPSCASCQVILTPMLCNNTETSCA
ncbi:DUF4150 domain-containing protein [Archangium violaceum]|uniref:DUF4150 domain-containing protein n=1 Tax=Archangium violaceum TaxID=83451 RepID=UPI00193C86A9|nr:DUF4150 domain-containing protein [Archangium violaceum]QRK12466.1 DUF4150 domain-containing protein [Archangium violaceum]